MGEKDLDRTVGFWIPGQPYLWIEGESVETSKRFYMFTGQDIAFFDEKNQLVDPVLLGKAYNESLLDPKETFSLIPAINGCEYIRNYFLVWTFPIEGKKFKDLMFDVDYVNKKGNQVKAKFPWSEKKNMDVRHDGFKWLKTDTSIPYSVYDNENIITVEDTYLRREDKSFHLTFKYVLAYGFTFTENFPFSVESGKIIPYGVISPVKYNMDSKSFPEVFNLMSYVSDKNLDLKTIRKIHVEALKNRYINILLIHEDVFEQFNKMSGKKKHDKEKLEELKNKLVFYHDAKRRVMSYLKELGEEVPGDKDKVNGPFEYTEEYINNDITDIKLIYETVIGKRPKYFPRIFSFLPEKVETEKCVVSKSLELWIQKNKYYQDRNRNWAFNLPSELGYEELCKLSHIVENLLSINLELIKKRYPKGKIETHIKEGSTIYDKKPSFATGVTWSQEDYSHLGLLREYIRYKSIQRFTETWEMMRRSYNIGLLDKIVGKKTSLRICSMAGGPGFELYSIREFFKIYYPGVKIEGTSLDLEKSWEPYVEEMGFRFEEWDTSDGEHLEEKCGGKVDFGIISYALYMYMNKDIHIEWMSYSILSDIVPFIFINSRKRNLKVHKKRMREEGILSINLISQNDDRQFVYHSPGLKLIPPKIKIPVTFPNVPHEDNKKGK